MGRTMRLADERDTEIWLETGQLGLANELRGELEPRQVADRTIAFLARYLGAPAGVIYHDDEGLRPVGSYGIAFEQVGSAEGLVVEAARRSAVTVVSAPAGHLPLRSGLTAGDARSIVLVPLVRGSTVRGVLELAVLAEWSPLHERLLLAVRESVAIALDVAHARSATDALLARAQRQARDLLAERRDLEDRAAELVRANAYKSQFLASVSHELRTPLNAIIGFAELLYDNTIPRDSPDARDSIGDILRSGRHLLQLINDVLDLSKVEAGKLELVPQRTKLSAVIAEVTSTLEPTTAKAHVQIAAEVAPEVDDVTLDPSRLKQVLYNFLSNALKFTPAGGRVTVRALPYGDDAVKIEVEDTGIGIAPEDLGRLFADFQQTREGTQRGGTGLGLALTKRLVEAQGGSVGVRSTVGKGSVFHAILPRKVAGAPAAARVV